MEYKMRQKKKWQYAQEIYSFPKLIQGSPETCTRFLEDNVFGKLSTPDIITTTKTTFFCSPPVVLVVFVVVIIFLMTIGTT